MPRTLLTAASSAGTAAVLMFAVSACGGGSSPSTATPTSGATSGTQQNQSARPGFGQGLPGASGKVAAIAGTTMQVQNATGQVAVTYTTKTRFTDEVKATAFAVTVGTCVVVRGAGGQAATTATTAPVTAVSVALTAPVNGECGGRGGFGGGGFGGGGFGGARPSGAPSGAPGGGASTGGQRGSGRFAGARRVSGRVTAVNGSTLTVAAVTFAGRGTVAGGGTASPAPTPTTSPVEVRTTAATTYTKTVAGTAKDLAVGACVTAVGPANDTGAVTATLIASQPAVNGQCTTGFGGAIGRPTSGAS